MKKMRNILMFLALAFCLLLIPGEMVRAEETETELYNNDKKQSIQISIEYEVDDVSVTIISPSGDEYDLTKENKNMDSFVLPTGIYTVILNAEEGMWRIRYDKGSNEYITVHCDVYETPLWITELDITEITEDRLTVSFLAEHEREQYYTATFYLTTSNEPGDGVLLATYYAAANTQNEFYIYPDDWNTYNNYYLWMHAEYEKDGIIYTDDAYSDAFSYENTKEKEAPENIEINVYPLENNMVLDWTNFISYSDNAAYLIVRGDGEELISQFFESSEATWVNVPFEKQYENIEIELTFRSSGGLVSKPLYRTVHMQPAVNEFTLICDAAPVVNTQVWMFEYRNASDNNVYIELNGSTDIITLSGEGKNYLSLIEGVNDINIMYLLPDKNAYYIYELTVDVDATAPAIELLEDVSGSTTENASIIIVGSTEENASVTINGMQVQDMKKGVFTHKLELAEGVNGVKIVAADRAGNEAVMQFEVTRITAGATGEAGVSGSDEPDDQNQTGNEEHRDSVSTSGSVLDYGETVIDKVLNELYPYRVLILTAIVSIIIITLMLILLMKSKGKPILDRMFVFTMILMIIAALYAVLGAVVYLYRRLYMYSKEYVYLAENSVEKAAAYIRVTDIAQARLIIALCVTGVFAASFVVCLIMRILRRRKTGKNVPQAGTQGYGSMNVPQAGAQSNGGMNVPQAGVQSNGGMNVPQAGTQGYGGMNVPQAGVQSNGSMNVPQAGAHENGQNQ